MFGDKDSVFCRIQQIAMPRFIVQGNIENQPSISMTKIYCKRMIFVNMRARLGSLQCSRLERNFSLFCNKQPAAQPYCSATSNHPNHILSCKMWSPVSSGEPLRRGKAVKPVSQLVIRKLCGSCRQEGNLITLDLFTFQH